MRKLISRVIDDLTEKHEPDFIILYGSVARGDHTAESDIDIACFCESPAVAKDVRMFEGRKLDCWIYAVAEANPESNAFLRFVGGKLFRDEKGEGREFLNQISARYEAGPEPISADARKHLEEWSKHMLERAAGSDIEANYRRISLPCELLEIYFKLRNRWYSGSRKSFGWLQENDRQAFSLFEKSFSNPANMDVLAQLVDATINTGITAHPDHDQPDQ